MYRRLAAAAAGLLGALLAPATRAAQPELVVQDTSLYLESDREAEKLLDAAREAARAENWRAAVEAYQRVADFTGKKGSQPLVPSRTFGGVYLPIQEAAALEVARLPRPAIELYRQAHDAIARRLFDRALAARDPSLLAEVARHYLASSWGDDALAAQGAIAFERGDMVGALAAWRRLVEACPEPSVPLASICARLWVCHRALGDEHAADALARDLLARQGAGSLQVGGKSVRLADFLGQPPALGSEEALSHWPMIAGDASHGRPARGITEVGEPLFAFRLPAPALSDGDRLEFIRKGLSVPLPIHPAIAQGRLFVNTEAAACALDAAKGRIAWMYPDGPEPPQTPVLDESLYGPACADGRVFARLADGVVAFEASSGRVLWRHTFTKPDEPLKEERKEEKAEKKEGKRRKQKGDGQAGSPTVLLATPPVVAGQRVVLGLTQLRDEARASVLALDAATGREVWRTFVCSRSVRAFLGLGASGGPPAVSGGTLYYSTNLGAVAALDLATGGIQWVQRYPSFSTQLRQSALERSRRWANNPPIAAGAWVVVAPQDAASVFALDAASGAVAWSAPREGARYVVGVEGSRVLLVGPTVQALDRATGRRLWSAALPDRPAGRPALAPEVLYVPTERGIVAVRTKDGSLTTCRLWQSGERPGNLALADGKLYVAAGDRVEAFGDWATQRPHLEEQAEKRPDGLGPALALAAHLAHRGDFAAALPLVEKVRSDAAAKGAQAIEARARLYQFTCQKALGELGDAVSLARAVECAPNAAEAAETCRALARLHEREKRWADAIAAHQPLLQRFAAARCRLDGGLSVGARELAIAEIARLVREQGRAVYAAQEAEAKKLLAAAKTPAELDAIVRRFPNSAAAEQAVLERLCQPGAEKSVPGLAALAFSLAADPASPARELVTMKLAALQQSLLGGHPPLTRRWQVYTRVALRRIEPLHLPQMPPGLVYFATARSTFPRALPFDGLECRRLDTGQLVWQRELVEWDRLAVVAGDTLVVATFDRLVGVDARSGLLRWAYSFGDGRRLTAADLAEEDPGMRRRRSELSRVVALAASPRSVYAGLAGGQVVAFSPLEGEVRWTRRLEGGQLLAYGLFVEGDKVWACIEQPATLYALDEADGLGEPVVAPKTREGGGRLFALPRITDRPTHDAQQGRLYLVLDDRAVRAVDLRAARELWEADVTFGISSILASPNGQRCYVLPDSYVAEGQIVSLDPATGRVRRRRSLRTGSLADARFAADTLYVALKDTGRDVVVQALDPDTLGERWRTVPLPLFRPSRLALGEGFLALTGRHAAQTVAILVDTANGKIAGDLKPEGVTAAYADFAGDVLCLCTDRGIHAFAATVPEQLDQRIAALKARLDGGDRAALAPLATALYQRGEEDPAIALLAQALTDESLPLADYAALKDQLNSLRESLAERRQAVLTTPFLATPPNIDGAINEAWRPECAAYLDGPAFIDDIQGVPPADSRWHSASDLSAVLYTGWDARHFYFAIDVTDDIQRTYTSNAESWIGDGLIISIDCDNDGGYGYSFHGRDVLLTLALTRKDERREEDAESPEGDYRVRRKEDNSGTVYEIAIPWSYLNLEPKAGTRFGFNVTVLDDDGDRTTKAISWTPGMILDRNRSMMIRGFTPAYFGKIILTGPPSGPTALWPALGEPKDSPPE